jgi:hypothetical protein
MGNEGPSAPQRVSRPCGLFTAGNLPEWRYFKDIYEISATAAQLRD